MAEEEQDDKKKLTVVINTDRELKNMKVIVIQIIFLHIFSSCIFASSCPSKPVYGICYSPFRAGQKPGESYPTVAQINADLSLIADDTTAIRTYHVDETLFDIASDCNTLNIDCYVGGWISGNPVEDQNTISDLIAIANENYATTKALIVGNEYVYGDMSDPLRKPYLLSLIQQVKSQVDIPVSTSEPWDVWFSCPNLATEVDFISINVHPFWRGYIDELFLVDINNAAQEVVNLYDAVQESYPDKEIIVTETGWPTEGEPWGIAIASEENQQKFLAEFLPLAKKYDIKYFLFEAFDEPYKATVDPPYVEDHWGIYYEDRTIKPGFANIVSASSTDINFDGTVNLQDYSYLSTDWQTNRDCENLCLAGDINHDCNVNLEDLLLIVSDWLLGYE